LLATDKFGMYGLSLLSSNCCIRWLSIDWRSSQCGNIHFPHTWIPFLHTIITFETNESVSFPC
jgi:hypothetical protein